MFHFLIALIFLALGCRVSSSVPRAAGLPADEMGELRPGKKVSEPWNSDREQQDRPARAGSRDSGARGGGLQVIPTRMAGSRSPLPKGKLRGLVLDVKKAGFVPRSSRVGQQAGAVPADDSSRIHAQA